MSMPVPPSSSNPPGAAAGPPYRVLSFITRALVSAGILALALLVTGALWWTQPMPESADLVRKAPQVDVIRARKVAVSRTWSAYGEARAMDAADVPARVSTTVSALAPGLERGASVKAGDLLATLDDTDFQRQLEIASQAIADLDAQLERLTVEEASWQERRRLAAEEVKLIQADYERIRAAAEGGAAKERELDRARQAVLVAERLDVAAREEFDKIPSRRAGLLAQRSAQESTRNLAQTNVERCRVLSPIDGVIEAVDVDEGENVLPGERIARIVNLDRIEVTLRIPSSARASVAIGDAVTISSEAAAMGTPTLTWTAKVTRLSPVDDPQTRTFNAFVEVEGGDGSPMPSPGRFVRGQVVSNTAEPRVVLPRRSVSADRVYEIIDDTVSLRPVDVEYHLEQAFPELGLPDRQWVVLGADFPEDVLVMVNASRALAPGAKVQTRLVGDAATPAASEQTIPEPAR